MIFNIRYVILDLIEYNSIKTNQSSVLRTLYRKETKMNETPFRRMGTMLDCSRNAVMNVNSLKKWIDICAKIGFNTVLLYTEDTYEIPEEPYFGYLRGRYSQAEIKEVDAFAKERGVELIPCIQTLAHVNGIVRWPAFAPIIDTADILLGTDVHNDTLANPHEIKAFGSRRIYFTEKI